MRPLTWGAALRPDSEQFLRLDALRFFAASAIVFHHWKTSLRVPSSWALYLDRAHVLTMAVDLFFIVSGLIIGAVYSGKVASVQQIRLFAWRRVARLVPLHLLTLAFVLAVGFSTQIASLAPLQFDLKQLPFNLLLLNALPFVHAHLAFNIVIWSISAELFCYAMFPLFIRSGISARWLAAPALLLTLLFLFRPRLHSSLQHFPLFRAIPPFLFGIALEHWRRDVPRVPFAGSTAFLLAAVALALALLGVQEGRLYAFPSAIVFVTLSADRHARPSWWATSLAPLGQLTYSLYMWHIPLALPFLYFGVTRLSAIEQNSLVLLALPLLLCLAYASLRWFETPARKKLSALAGTSLGRQRSERMGSAMAP